jgi:hypothetical protein
MAGKMDQQLPKATPELARAVWQRQRLPSARSVARALTQSGRPVHFTIVNRWQRYGWRAEPIEHPLGQARADLECALPLVTGDPTTTIEDLLRNSPDREQLEEFSDAELLRKAAREVLIAVCAIAQAMMRQAALFVTKPALAECYRGRHCGVRTGAEHARAAWRLRRRAAASVRGVRIQPQEGAVCLLGQCRTGKR